MCASALYWTVYCVVCFHSETTFRNVDFESTKKRRSLLNAFTARSFQIKTIIIDRKWECHVHAHTHGQTVNRHFLRLKFRSIAKWNDFFVVDSFSLFNCAIWYSMRQATGEGRERERVKTKNKRTKCNICSDEIMDWKYVSLYHRQCPHSTRRYILL